MRGLAVRIGFWWDRVAWDRTGRPKLSVSLGASVLNLGLGVVGGAWMFRDPWVTFASLLGMILAQTLRAWLDLQRWRAVYG